MTLKDYLKDYPAKHEENLTKDECFELGMFYVAECIGNMSGQFLSVEDCKRFINSLEKVLK